MYLQVTSPHWSAFCCPGNDRINEIILSWSALQIQVYLYSSLGCSCPSSSDLPPGIFPAIFPSCWLLLARSPACSRTVCVLQCSRCAVGVTSIVIWQLHHPVDSFTPTKSLSVNYCRTQGGRKYCTDGTKDY